MKKVFSFLIALLFIPLIVVGCGTNNEYVFTNTGTSNPCNFFGGIVDGVSALYNKTSGTEYTVSLASDAYVSAGYDNAWSTINKCNAETSFALACHEMFKFRKSVGFYDLSMMSTTENNLLKNFNIYYGSKSDDEKYYYYYHDLTGTETDETNLPVSKMTVVSKNGATIGELKDIADDVIKTWGNKIKFTVSTANGREKIVVETIFEFPENTFTDTTKYKYDSGNNTITYVYQVGNITYSKVVAFNVSSGVVKKLVTKYKGDLISSPDTKELYNTAGSQYEYSLVMGDNATLNIFGTYNILYQEDRSYIYCEHTNTSINKTYKTEYYVTKTSEILGRFYESTTVVRAYDLLVNADKQTGNLKASRSTIAPASAHVSNTPLLSEEIQLTNKYASKDDGDALSTYKTYIYYYSLGATLEYTKVAN